MADITAINQIIFRGKDETGGAIRSVTGGLKSIESATSAISAKWQAFLGLAAAGGLTAMVKGAIDAADHLNDLAKQTGIAVETLGGLGYAAQQNGVDLETVSKGAQKLAQNMALAAGGNAEAASKFEAMGLAVRGADGALKPLNQMLAEVADKFASYKDGPEKAALAQDLFGKSGAALIGMLDEGGAKLAEMIAEYQAYGGITSDTAARADQFNDTVSKLTLMTTAFTRNLAAALLPTLQAVANIMVDARQKSGDFSGTIDVLVGAFKGLAIAGVGVVTAFQAVGKSIGTVIGAIIGYLKGDSLSSIWEGLKGGFNDVTAEISTGMSRIKTIWNADTATIANGTEQAFNNKVNAPIRQAVKAVQDYGDAVKKLLQPIQQLVDQLGKQNAALDAQLDSLRQYGIETKETTLAVTEYELANGKVGQALLALSLVYPQAAEALRAYLLVQARHKDQTEALIEIEKEYIAARKDEAAALANGLDDLDRAIRAEQDHATALGKTRAELVALQIAEEEHNLALLQEESAYADLGVEIAAATARIAKLKELKGAVLNTDQLQASRQAWTDVLSSIADRGAQFIEDFVQHGSSAFKNLWEDFKAWALSALAKIAAQQIIVSIVGSWGGVAGSVASGLFGGNNGALGGFTNLVGGGSSILGGLFSNGSAGVGGLGGFSSFMGGLPFVGGAGPLAGSGTGLAGMFAGAGFPQLGAFAAGMGSPLATLGSLFSGGGLAAAGGIAGVLGAAVPIIGIGLAIASMLGAFKHGGPKTGGSAAVDVDVANSTITQSTDFQRYFTPNQADSQLLEVAQKMGSDYDAIARSLGATTGTAQFQVGFDTDPNGTANSRVSAGAIVNGVQVYNAHDVDAGRGDDAQLQAQLTLESKRALLAALQASDLPSYLANVLNQVPAATADAGAIDQIIQTAQAFKIAVDTMRGASEQLAALDPDQITSLVNAFGGVDQMTKGLAFIQDAFTTSAEKQAKLQAQVTKDFSDLGLAVPKTHKEFLNLLEGLDLTTEAGQKMYASLVQLAPEFVAVAGTADQAAQALKQQVDSAQQVFDQNFYSQSEQDAKRIAGDWDKVHGTWTELGSELLALGVDHIPTSISGFRSLVESIDTSTEAGKRLYNSLILLAPTVLDLNGNIDDLNESAKQAATSIGGLVTVSVGTLLDQGRQWADMLLGQVQNLANAAGDYGQVLSTQIALIGKAINEAPSKFSGDTLTGYQGELQSQYDQAVDHLTRFTVLSAQYDAGRAQQLVQLQDWYAQQQQIFYNNQQALAAAKQIFDDKWKGIVDGVSTGVDGALDQLDKLRQGILAYVQGLLVSDLSPLTPGQKLAQAQQQYQDELARAQAGNVDALGNVTKLSDAYLKAARDYFASSPQYSEIFSQVVGQLTALGNGVAEPAGGGAAALSAALPRNSTLASQDDVRQMTTEIIEALQEMSRNIGDTQAVKASVDKLSRRLETADRK